MPPTTVILVHGTSATSDAWEPTTAALKQKMHDLEPLVVYRTFSWSGENSHEARLKAAGDLVDLVLREPSETGQLVFIGHSHGGNVCLYATRHPMVAPRVSRIITLGTPFINVRKRDLASGWSAALISATLYLFILACIVLAKLTMTVDWQGISSFGTLLAVVVTFALVALAGRFLYWLAMDADALLDKTMKVQDEEFARITHQSRPIPLHAFRVPLDEAGLLLRSLHIVSELPAFTFSFLLSARDAFLEWGDRLARRGLFAAIYLAPDRFFHGLLSALLYFPLGLVFLAIVVVPKAVRGHAAGFGEHGFTQNVLLDIGSTSKPPGGWPASLAEVRPGKTALRHSTFFTDQSVIDFVATLHVQSPDCPGLVAVQEPGLSTAVRAGRLVGSSLFWFVLLIPLWVVLAAVVVGAL